MAAGELSSTDRQLIDTTIRRAEQLSRCEFSVFVGNAGDNPRAFATRLHNSLVAPSRSVVVMVDPRARAVEVVWGSWTRPRLTDAEVDAAIAQMSADFAGGDLVGGIVRGIERLAQDAKD
ncbi:DUF5130 family protein [Nocardioides sp.]|uniref:DUF5130 family protein n=1 Tax=Nocardioides sp. TaxID=35761 RepID=UPI002735E35D|nr:DUF5130 family protein [Nocardioides sp.]MDP3894035.1 DUF5130 family protein [Nocardioides sp.]